MSSHRLVVPNTFRDVKEPEGYIAGIGRGALPISTADVGAGFGRGGTSDTARRRPGYEPTGEADNEADRVKQQRIDNEDEEAELIWKQVEDKMTARRKRGRDTSATTSSSSKEKLKISDQFADLKQHLKQVKYEEWDAISESNTGLRRHKRQENVTAVSDSIILSNANVGTNLNIERSRMIRDRLDDNNNPSSSSVDTSGYLTSLSGLSANVAETQVGDIKKARSLFKSVTSTNPQHAPAWIAYARLEEVAGKLIEARRIIKEGCQACPTNEDIWIEAARLNTPANAKVIMESAIQTLSKSVRIWLAAAELEGSDVTRKKRVLRRALEVVPSSEKLWKALVSLSDEAEAHIMLARATECVPHSVDMWLALAQMEDFDQARIVLNRARKKNPTEPRIWLAACSLEEAKATSSSLMSREQEEKLGKKLEQIMSKAIRSLSAPGNVLVDREGWLKHAQEMEEAGSLFTSRSIIKSTLSLGLEETDWRRTWIDDAAEFEMSGATECARALHLNAVERYPGVKQVLLKAIAFEKKSGTHKTLAELLNYAVEKCPDVELFWLMAAKTTWKPPVNDVEGARSFLSRAFKAGHGNSERVWLASVKLEWDTQQVERARALLAKARTECSTAKIWMKSALLERVELSKMDPSTNGIQIKVVQGLLKTGCEKFPAFDKLWMMAGQLVLEYVVPKKRAAFEDAKKLFVEGLKHCPNSVTLWILASRLEKTFVSVVKARLVLELARLKNPKNEKLLLETVRLERDSGHVEIAKNNMAKALQECPKSGILWADEILHAAKPERRSKSADALQHCDQDTVVLCAVAQLLASDRKKKGARKWFESAVAADPDNGDAWLQYYRFEKEIAKSDTAADLVLQRCIAAEPHHGEKWQEILKKDENRFRTIEQLLKSQVLPLNDV